MDLIAWSPNLTFLDISFAKQITDEGLTHFKERKLPIKKLFVNGMISISSAGLSDLINTCQSTLKIFEAGLMD